MQPSRRAFLMGGRRAGGEWGRFYQRLARLVQGRLEDRSAAPDGRHAAWLRPARPVDVHHARALCAELGVTLVLEGSEARARGPHLLVDVSALDALRRTEAGLWRAQPGVCVGALRRHLPEALFEAADDATLAAWLTGTGAARAGLDELGASGLVAIDVLLADGSMESFGPFGADARRSALSASASGLVSALFTLAHDPLRSGWREFAVWPGRYRLDALLAPHPNLAWLLAGSAGTLAWADSLTFVAPPAPAATPLPVGAPASPAAAAAATEELDAAIKRRFDPGGVYGHLPPAVV